MILNEAEAGARVAAMEQEITDVEDAPKAGIFIMRWIMGI